MVGPAGERIEVQIRTREMHRIAEQGVAAHWAYKEKRARREGPGDVPQGRGQEFGWLRQLVEWQRELADPREFLETVKVDLFSDEVFVFTPKGEVKSMPRGATPVDFAYSIHSQVGEHCVGAKVNGKLVPLRNALKNGDTVEILTSPHSHPSKDWLGFVKTSRAQARIRQFLRQAEHRRSVEIGRELAERELRRFGLTLNRAAEERGAGQGRPGARPPMRPRTCWRRWATARSRPLQLLQQLVPAEKLAETPAAQSRGPQPHHRALPQDGAAPDRGRPDQRHRRRAGALRQVLQPGPRRRHRGLHHPRARRHRPHPGLREDPGASTPSAGWT